MQQQQQQHSAECHKAHFTVAKNIRRVVVAIIMYGALGRERYVGKPNQKQHGGSP